MKDILLIMVFIFMQFTCAAWETEETGPVPPDFWGMRRTPMYSQGFVLCKNYDTLQYEFMDSICGYVTRTIVDYSPLFEYCLSDDLFLELDFYDYEKEEEEIWNPNRPNVSFKENGSYIIELSGDNTRMYEYSFNYGPYTIETTYILSPFFTKFNRVDLYEDTVLDYVERGLCRGVLWKFIVEDGRVVEALFTDFHQFYYDLMNNRRIKASEFGDY